MLSDPFDVHISPINNRQSHSWCVVFARSLTPVPHSGSSRAQSAPFFFVSPQNHSLCVFLCGATGRRTHSPPHNSPLRQPFLAGSSLQHCFRLVRFACVSPQNRLKSKPNRLGWAGSRQTYLLFGTLSLCLLGADHLSPTATTHHLTILPFFFREKRGRDGPRS